MPIIVFITANIYAITPPPPHLILVSNLSLFFDLQTARIIDLDDIPQDEDIVDSRTWLKKYGLSHLQMRIDQFIMSNCVPHSTGIVPITGGIVSSQHCNVFHVSIPKSIFHKVEIGEMESRIGANK